ncbi:hypothetical protein SAMN05216295_101363 [Pseudomonas luteola]|nr:hypothetical protein SAMN05216295_101363 [Pseudomonas zeshuii]
MNYFWISLRFLEQDTYIDPHLLVKDLDHLVYTFDGPFYRNLYVLQIATSLSQEEVYEWLKEQRLLGSSIVNQHNERRSDIAKTNNYDAYQAFVDTYKTTYANTSVLTQLQEL